MRIIHTGDIHLGAAMRNLPPDKAQIRKAELTDSFRRLATYAKENGVGAVLIAGDLFDGNRVEKTLKAEILSVIGQAEPVCFFYVSGNHDDELVFEGEKPRNLYLFSQNRGWLGYDLPDGITVTGIDGKNLRPEAYAALELRPDRYNIVMLHGEVALNAATGEQIPLARLQNKNIDYLALGHIHIPMHTPERLDGRGKYRYCGCLEGRGFDECGKKGCFLLDIRGGWLVNESFVSVAKREVGEYTADVSACKSYYDVERAAFDALKGVSAGGVIRLVLRGRHVAGLKKDLPLLESRLSQSYFFVKVKDESRTFIDYAAYRNDLSELGEFVREVGRYEMSEELRSEILDVGFKALAGEEIDL